jgi:hypothetical protein
MIFFLLFSYAASLYASEDSSTTKSLMKLIPDISLIIDASYLYRTVTNDNYPSLQIPNVVHSSSETNSKNGFNFNYAELVLESSVDPYFNLFAVFHIGMDSIEIEEAFVRTSAIPGGIQVKLGKFKSGFGRLNSQHEHSWSFADQPIVYNSFSVEMVFQVIQLHLGVFLYPRQILQMPTRLF